MKKFVAVVLAMVMVMSVCSFAAADEAVKIGLIGPKTGGAAVYGLAVERGAMIAIDEVNALGGVQLELNSQDDVNDAETGINAYNNLMDWGAQMILGTVTTTPCIAVAADAYEERVFMLTPSGSSTKIIEGRDNVYQVCFTDPAQGSASAQYIYEHQLATKIGIIYNNASDYSVGIYQTFMDKAKELGLEVVAETTFSDDYNADFSVQIAACKDKGADLIFLPIYYTPASMILNQSKAVAYAPTFFGVDGMDGILTMPGFDPALAEGVMLLTPFSVNSEDAATQSFVKTYTEKYGVEPNQFAADAYDGVYIVKAALEAAGCTGDMSSADICEALVGVMSSISVDGLTGQGMTWSANGEVSKAPMAVVIENGTYVLP